MGLSLCKHEKKLTAQEVTDIIKNSIYGNDYYNKLFIDRWYRINSKDKLDKFGILYVQDANKMFYLTEYHNMYVIDNDQTYKLSLTAKQSHEIMIKKKF
jgi:hypothetical protein